jgi:hypothetical protein
MRKNDQSAPESVLEAMLCATGHANFENKQRPGSGDEDAVAEGSDALNALSGDADLGEGIGERLTGR